jgi:hypothetical protein
MDFVLKSIKDQKQFQIEEVSNQFLYFNQDELFYGEKYDFFY